MTIHYHALDADLVDALRAGGPDANGAPAERAVSNGQGAPCRCCLKDIPAGAPILLLSHRPFPAPQPYAEAGPIFLCETCERAEAGAEAPPIIATRAAHLVKGYTADHRIKYGTGQITPTEDVHAYCEALLERGDIAFVDIRSSVNNCFFCRVMRA
ncbi:MAG: DUF1203 domain-containing protein [Pseudomonadota bacterium]